VASASIQAETGYLATCQHQGLSKACDSTGGAGAAYFARRFAFRAWGSHIHLQWLLPCAVELMRRTFGVLSAYFRRTILPNWHPRLRVHLERDSRAQSRESVPVRPASRIERGNIVAAEKYRELRAGHRYGETGAKRRKTSTPKRRMSQGSVLTHVQRISLRNFGSPIGTRKNAPMVNAVRPSSARVGNAMQLPACPAATARRLAPGAPMKAD
jgi:hypothetical protein